MSIEVDSVDCNNRYFEGFSCPFSEESPDPRERIFAQSLEQRDSPPSRKASKRQCCVLKSFSIGPKIQKIAHDRKIVPMGTNVSGEVGVTASWGGDKGVEVSGHASGSVSDDKGNKVEPTVEVKGDGSGSASVSAKSGS